MDLLCTYWGSQANRTFDILVDDVKVATQALNNEKSNQFFDATYSLPPESTRGKTKVTIKFQAAQGATGRGAGAGPLFYAATLKK
jgi:hypothetical protein